MSIHSTKISYPTSNIVIYYPYTARHFKKLNINVCSLYKHYAAYIYSYNKVHNVFIFYFEIIRAEMHLKFIILNTEIL